MAPGMRRTWALVKLLGATSTQTRTFYVSGKYFWKAKSIKKRRPLTVKSGQYFASWMACIILQREQWTYLMGSPKSSIPRELNPSSCCNTAEHLLNNPVLRALSKFLLIQLCNILSIFYSCIYIACTRSRDLWTLEKLGGLKIGYSTLCKQPLVIQLLPYVHEALTKLNRSSK